MTTALKLFALTIGLLAGTAGAQQHPQAAAKTGPICVAVLEPEVLDDLPQQDRKALAGWLDALLAESLAGREGFVTVDRQGLDQVLAEKKLEGSGAARVAAEDVAAPLRRFWSAGVLLCPTIRQDGKQGGKLLVRVEAVASQTGQKLAELFGAGTWRQGRWASPVWPQQAVEDFYRDVRRGIEAGAGAPLVEIADGRLASDLGRAQWMVDDLADAARADTAADPRCVLLTPRQAVSTKEERLLRLMGLSVRRDGDSAAALAPAPDARLTFELDEQIAEGLAVDKTPVVLKLAWSAGRSEPVTWSARGVTGQWDALRAKALAWLRARRAEMSSAAASGGEEAARQMARQELDLARRWQGLRFSASSLETQRQCRVVTHALRAAHLDPAGEEAAYLAATNVDALYAARGLEGSRACQDRVLAECQRYLDRFGGRVEKPRRQQVVDRLATAAFRCEAMVAPRRGLALSSRQNLELYRYASIFVPIWLEKDAGDAASPHPGNPDLGNLWASSWMLRLDLVMNCPADRLDQEHARWRKFWKDRVEKLAGDAPPWDLIEVFFQVRSKDWRKAREAFQRLAGKYDESVRRVWRYGETPLLPHMLRAARDPEWSTWRPEFAKGLAREIRQQDFSYAMNIVWVPFLDIAPNSGPCLPVSKMVLPRQSGEDIAWGARPAEVLAVIDGQMWIASPGVDPGNERPNRLWVARVPEVPEAARKPLGNEHWLGAKAVPVEVSPKPVAWPSFGGKTVEPAVTCSLVWRRGDRVELLLGTRAHGIARFTRKGTDWSGRWITAREGIPVEQIEAIARAEIGGRELWVVAGRDAIKERRLPNGEKHLGADIVLWTIDPRDATVRILFRGVYDKLKEAVKADPVRRARCAVRLPAEVTAGLDVDKTSAADLLAERKPLVLVGRRLWRIDGSALAELSPKTLRPVGGAIGGTAQWAYLPGESTAGMMTFGSFFWHHGRMDTTYDWPAVGLRLAVAWQGRIVMVLGSTSSENLLALYRPAPAGSTDWAADDQWAFYRAPERSVVRSLHADADGALWLSTSASLLRLNEAQLPSLATTFPQTVESTRQWRDGWHDYYGSDGLWKRDVVVCIARRQWDKALERIDRYARNESAWRMSDELKKRERLAIPFWRARVYAEQPGTADKALAIYAALAVDRSAPDAVRLLARICQVLVLHQARRWPELVTAYDAATAAFPQLRAREGSGDTLATLVEQAHRELSKGRAAPPKKAMRLP